MKLKYTIVVLALSMVVSVPSNAGRLDQPMCEVRVCNKISRFSLDIMSHIKDSLGEVCDTVVLPKTESYVGNVLSSESRWWQGSSINPTKKSVTKVVQVLECQNEN